MRPSQYVVIESGKISTVFWGENACFIQSEVEELVPVKGTVTYRAACIKMPNPYKFFDSTITLSIPYVETIEDMHFSVEGIELVDLWARKVSDGR